jgi:hypothetical protein
MVRSSRVQAISQRQDVAQNSEAFNTNRDTLLTAPITDAASIALYAQPVIVRGAMHHRCFRCRSAHSWTLLEPSHCTVRGVARGAEAQQPNRTSPHEPPRTRPTALRQWPAMQGFVRGAVPRVSGWHARGQGFKSPQLHTTRAAGHPPAALRFEASLASRSAPLVHFRQQRTASGATTPCQRRWSPRLRLSARAVVHRVRPSA